MFFDGDIIDEDDDLLNPVHIIEHKMYFIAGPDYEFMPRTRCSIRTVPTHTEDGIPIRKLYVSNLPPKTTRTQLFELFAQYGFIKSCWLRMGENGIPTYAFVTFSDPADAHKALMAPNYGRSLRGRFLKVSPADSWHQPAEDADGNAIWKQRRNQPRVGNEASDDNGECSTSSAAPEATGNEEQSEGNQDADPQYDIMDILNRDCIHAILQYVPIKDLIRCQGVNRRWMAMVQDYFTTIHTLKTSWWKHDVTTLTTAVLRSVLRCLGAGLTRLHIDHHVSALNDRTAHIVGKFCPNLEELKIVNLNTKNWNPLVYGCKNLKVLTFISCNKLGDSNLVQMVKEDSCLESLAVADNSRVTGLFLAGAKPSRLRALAFHNCFSIQGKVLSAAIKTLSNLTVLKLDVGPSGLWKVVPSLLKKLPQLEELSLCEYIGSDSLCVPSNSCSELLEAFEALVNIRKLHLSRNIYITNEVLKTIAKTCTQLVELDVSCCNYKRRTADEGVGDEGVAAICQQCKRLETLNVSYLAALSDAGVAAVARSATLRTLIARGVPELTAAPFAKCVAACHELEELDVCGCFTVGSELVEAANRAVGKRPRKLLLRMAGTSVSSDYDTTPLNALLRLDAADDRSNPRLRPDFVDDVYGDDDDDDSLDDRYDPNYYNVDEFDVDDDYDFFDPMMDSDEFDFD